MAFLRAIPDIINGFKVIQDLGSIPHNGKKRRMVIAECKVCGNHFTECVEVISRPLRLACSRQCSVDFKLTLIKTTPGYNCEFKILCTGVLIKGKRQVVAECPFCLNPFSSTLQSLLRTTQCGCLNIKGHYPQRLLRIRNNMIQRCTNPNSTNWPRYGARGITVCEEWLSKPHSFPLWAMINGYSDELSLDRIDNDGPYHPDNCKFSTRKMQMANTRSSVVNLELIKKVAADLKLKIMRKDICVKHGISDSTFARIKREFIDVHQNTDN